MPPDHWRFDYFAVALASPSESEVHERVEARVEFQGGHPWSPSWKDTVGALKREVENYQTNGNRVSVRSRIGTLP